MLVEMTSRRYPVPIAAVAVLLVACADPSLDVAASNGDGGSDAGGETANGDGGDGGAESVDAADVAETDDSGGDATGDADTDGLVTGVGLPCTNMEQCAGFGLVCLSHDDPTCTIGHCLQRYTCEPHPEWDKCTSDSDCRDIHCVGTADCPTGANFCVGEMIVDSDSHVAPFTTAKGFRASRCSGGTPAMEPSPTSFVDVTYLYTCTGDGDCIMAGDGGTYSASCCHTSIGISYCASSCEFK